MLNLNFKLKKFKGLTLIEIAIILVILGLLIGMTVPLLSELTKHRHYTSTQKDMEEIKSALVGYAGMHWSLPYADTDGNGVGNTGQFSGTLPYVDLGLGAVDSWRNAYRYDVNGTLTSTATQTAFCTALQNIGSNDDPRVAFSAGGNATPQAIVVISSGEDSTLNGGNIPFPGDRDYESYAPTDTFDDLVIALSPSYLYGKFGCGGGGGGPSCTSYSVRNGTTGGTRIYVTGGSYTCTRINNNGTFTINSGETISVYWDLGCTLFAASITFSQAQAADSDGDCAVSWNGTNLIDE